MGDKRVIIIGSGPAGLTAGIYTARANLETKIIAGEQFGGQPTTTTLVENYPGFAEGVMGPKLMQNMVKQVQNQGAEVIYKSASRVELEGETKKVYIGEEEHIADAVIIATGSSPKKLNVPGEEKYWAKGVSTCATCDGGFYKDKIVAVIGGGDTAMEEAKYLANIAKRVYVIHRRDELRASKVMQEKVLKLDNVEIIWDTIVEEIIGDEIVNALKVKNVKDDTVKKLEVDGMFLAIGHIPNTDIFRGQIDLDESGYVKSPDGYSTSLEGVFVAGDVYDHIYRQVVTAAGMGCKAAMELERWISSI